MPQQDVAWAVADLNARAKPIRHRQRYRDGDHDEVLPRGGKDLSPLMKRLVTSLNDNLCDDVVTEPADRLSVIGWSGKANGVGADAEVLWEESRGDARLRELLLEGFTCGDGWAIVEDTEEGPRWYQQNPAWMAARYSPERPNEIQVAAKAWQEGKAWRLNLYYSPRPEQGENAPWMERYTTKSGNSEGTVPGHKSFAPCDDEKGPVVEFDTMDRIPVFHFPVDVVGGYGRPLLSETVLGLQDVLNKAVVDMVVNSEATAIPDRWAVGITTEIDPATGLEKPLKKSGNERMLRVGTKEASFGQFATASMDSFVTGQSQLRNEIARKGKLPPWSVDPSGDAPSGLALLLGEGKAVKLCSRVQDYSGTELRQMVAFMLRMSGTEVTASDLEVQWAPTSTRDMKALLEELVLKHELGLPKREALIEAGYDEDDVDEWLEEAQATADRIAGGGSTPPGGASPFLRPPGEQIGAPAAPMGPAGAAQPVA